MDLGHQQDSDTQEPVFYPVPHSHWFPRPIAFRAYNSSGGRSQQDAGLRGARRLHIQISRPVRLKPYLGLPLLVHRHKNELVGFGEQIYLELCEHARLLWPEIPLSLFDLMVQ